MSDRESGPGLGESSGSVLENSLQLPEWIFHAGHSRRAIRLKDALKQQVH